MTFQKKLKKWAKSDTWMWYKEEIRITRFQKQAKHQKIRVLDSLRNFMRKVDAECINPLTSLQSILTWWRRIRIYWGEVSLTCLLKRSHGRHSREVRRTFRTYLITQLQNTVQDTNQTRNFRTQYNSAFLNQ